MIGDPITIYHSTKDDTITYNFVATNNTDGDRRHLTYLYYRWLTEVPENDPNKHLLQIHYNNVTDEDVILSFKDLKWRVNIDGDIRSHPYISRGITCNIDKNSQQSRCYFIFP